MTWIDDVLQAVNAGDVDGAYVALRGAGVQRKRVSALDVRRYATLLAEGSIDTGEFLTLVERAAMDGPA